MLVALYIGDHAQDALSVRLGAWATRLVQKGPYGRVTHAEAILAGVDYRCVDIASSSVRDGGVRTKRKVALTPGHWMVVDVPQWNADRARRWFVEHDGEPYDWRGAWATVMPGHHAAGHWFCNQSIGTGVGLLTPEAFTPAQFAAICLTLGRDVTQEFFMMAGAAQHSWMVA